MSLEATSYIQNISFSNTIHMIDNFNNKIF